jgi:hypothetical protein
MSDENSADDFLKGLVNEWKASTPTPPAELEGRILRAVRAAREEDKSSADDYAGRVDDGRRPAEIIPWHRPAAWPRPVWAGAGALAAMLAIGSMLTIRATFFIPAAPQQAERLLVADALRDAEAAEREHARAIARLEEIAGPILAKADDPELSGTRAARLMALGNRLRFLDQTIAEINDFLEQNTGHPGARTTLLAAYTEKTDVLRDVIAFDEEITS